MPTKQGGRALKNASTSDRCSFRHNTALPAASTPCSWKTRLAMSKPTVVISIVDGSFNSLLLTARAWHIDAVRGRPPHQMGFILSWIRHTATLAMRVLRLNLPKNGPADTSFRFSAPRMVSDDIVVPLSAASVSADLLVSVRFQGMTTT